ncbi:MAG: type I restriction endonuclease [Pseudomonadota bacterium]
MDLIDRIADLRSRIQRQKDHVATEEAAKHAFVLPFLQALGFDVFNPLEVTPEFVADVGVKKGEKVDYAVRVDGDVQILIECKPIGSQLELKHAGQLYRYFSVTSARFGVLTDGVKYLFYTDLDAPNKMDSKPFFVLDIFDYKDGEIDQLKKFTKDIFDVDEILSTAHDMKLQRSLAAEIASEFKEPSDELVSLIGKRVYSGKFTQQIAEKFSSLFKNALRNYIRARIDERLKSALESGVVIDEVPEEDDVEAGDIETTPEEIEGFQIVKAIGVDVVNPSRINMRDAKSYCAILLDDNNRRTIVRLHFNNPIRLSISIFGPNGEQKEKLEHVSDIYQYKYQIRDAIRKYLPKDGSEPTVGSEAMNSIASGEASEFGESRGSFGSEDGDSSSSSEF